MRPDFRLNATIATLLALGISGGGANGAIFASGYAIGSTTLTPGGEQLFIDQGQLGGIDLNSANGDFSAHLMEVQSGGMWSIGDTVQITGIAIPLVSGNPEAVNTTLNGTFTFTFRGLGLDNDFDLGDTVTFGAADVTFNSESESTSAYWAVFDTPITWVADSEAFGVQLQSDAKLRTKGGNVAGAGAEAENFFTGGTRTGYRYNMSVAGTVIPVPEPTSALLGALGLLTLIVRRR